MIQVSRTSVYIYKGYRCSETRVILCAFSQQVVMVFKDKPSHWIGNCTAALENAAMQFSLQGEGKEFSLFDSSPYCPMMNGETPIMNGETDIKDEELDEDDSKWATNMKNEDLIFKHHCTSLEKLPTVSSSLCIMLVLHFSTL